MVSFHYFDSGRSHDIRTNFFIARFRRDCLRIIENFAFVSTDSSACLDVFPACTFFVWRAVARSDCSVFSRTCICTTASMPTATSTSDYRDDSKDCWLRIVVFASRFFCFFEIVGIGMLCSFSLTVLIPWPGTTNSSSPRSSDILILSVHPFFFVLLVLTFQVLCKLMSGSRFAHGWHSVQRFCFLPVSRDISCKDSFFVSLAGFLSGSEDTFRFFGIFFIFVSFESVTVSFGFRLAFVIIFVLSDVALGFYVSSTSSRGRSWDRCIVHIAFFSFCPSMLFLFGFHFIDIVSITLIALLFNFIFIIISDFFDSEWSLSLCCWSGWCSSAAASSFFFISFSLIDSFSSALDSCANHSIKSSFSCLGCMWRACCVTSWSFRSVFFLIPFLLRVLSASPCLSLSTALAFCYDFCMFLSPSDLFIFSFLCMSFLAHLWCCFPFCILVFCVLLFIASGSGKTALVHELAWATINHEDLITIHIDDQIDSKVLLGTYICTETPGEFRFQPGLNERLFASSLSVCLSVSAWVGSVFAVLSYRPFDLLLSVCKETRRWLFSSPFLVFLLSHPFILFPLFFRRCLDSSCGARSLGADGGYRSRAIRNLIGSHFSLGTSPFVSAWSITDHSCSAEFPTLCDTNHNVSVVVVFVLFIILFIIFVIIIFSCFFRYFSRRKSDFVLAIDGSTECRYCWIDQCKMPWILECFIVFDPDVSCFFPPFFSWKFWHFDLGLGPCFCCWF